MLFSELFSVVFQRYLAQCQRSVVGCPNGTLDATTAFHMHNHRLTQVCQLSRNFHEAESVRKTSILRQILMKFYAKYL